MHGESLEVCLVGGLPASIIIHTRLSKGVAVTFEQLEDLFYALEIQASVSGFHGFLCGRLSCGPVQMESLVRSTTQWLGMEEDAAESAESALADFFESSLSNLQDASFIFQPLLPDDELPLSERLVALGDWCSNYVSGLGEGMADELEVSADTQEALQDITAIGQVSAEFDEGEDSERDYLELVEFIRVAVQLIFSDLDRQVDPEAQPTIH